MTPLLAPAVDLCTIPGLAVGCAAKSVAGAVTGGVLPGPGELAGGAVASLASSMIAELANGFFNAWWLTQAKIDLLGRLPHPHPRAADGPRVDPQLGDLAGAVRVDHLHPARRRAHHPDPRRAHSINFPLPCPTAVPGNFVSNCS